MRLYLDLHKAGRRSRTRDAGVASPHGAVQTGPRGGQYVEGPGGSKQYIGKSLWLDVSKAGTHRDPTHGRYMGGAVKAPTEDLGSVLELLDKLSGEDKRKTNE